MYTKSYQSVVNFLAERAPIIEYNPGKVIEWAEPLCDLLVFIYSIDYDQVTEDLYEAVKDFQEFEDDED